MSNTATIWSTVPEKSSIGERIRHAREAANLSSAQLARRLGVKTATVSGWESGRTEPRANRLTMLAGFLSVSPTWLLYGLGEAPADETFSSELAVLQASLKSVKDLHERTGQALERLEEQISRLSPPKD
ncbi:helix-turn-helix transcriptional regulator [Rhizobiales bacterium]|uniref:helix-turn-helix domain-containing protein n=1 Tax=Hongsoonwoonella zoysiae TaxID=2821844 RepID=UPI0015609C5E|nr:helix-turn-helix transcriptional regulator [Hongsoonwoonella zoysiae]NRG17870.1 helix-turn-helix transcriptional regulator [Hongsoonwoonella zoysiae]